MDQRIVVHACGDGGGVSVVAVAVDGGAGIIVDDGLIGKCASRPDRSYQRIAKSLHRRWLRRRIRLVTHKPKNRLRKERIRRSE